MAATNDTEYEKELRADSGTMLMLDRFRKMSKPMQVRFVKFSQRVAALPQEQQSRLTRELARYMFENDADFPDFPE